MYSHNSHFKRTLQLSIRCILNSYGTLAGNAWRLAQLLRSHFVHMYALVDALQTFKEDLETQFPASEFPETPPHGSLDLEAVLDSPFFFS
ncbi:hypothetical protein E1162_06225 [Rhodobacteraceae bacterium RKSG542]|nr:hypothetical protein [Pseudovibrio flavus]